MSTYNDVSFITRLSGRLRNFKKKSSDTWNFSCPLCGDSKKNTKKARGYLFKGSRDAFFYKCYNCNESMTFKRLLERIDASMAREYVTSRFTALANTAITSKPIEPEKEAPKLLFDKSKLGQFFTEIKNLPKNHFAYQYLLDRQIPKTIVETELFYTADFKQSVEDILAITGLGLSRETYAKMISNDRRIIIPFANESGEVTGFQGRSLDPKNPVRYITIKLDPYSPKVYGAHRLDATKENIYVFEGPFDSMFIGNSVAVMDSQLYKISDLLPSVPKDKFVLVYDREPRNPNIVRNIGKAIDQNFTVCLFPDTMKGKDINEMILRYGMTPSVLMNLITEYSCKGITAKLEFVKWKKIT